MPGYRLRMEIPFINMPVRPFRKFSARIVGSDGRAAQPFDFMALPRGLEPLFSP